ncbi:SCO family protein [Paenibacillus sp. y28]|uniref:SCO family protein n=1 Tax=Paenibacillus sp. y28 TaxID=3129110 RepID=UPI00301B5BE3
MSEGNQMNQAGAAGPVGPAGGKPNRGFIAITAVISLLLVGAIVYYMSSQGEQLKVIKAAANFTLPNMDGQQVSLQQNDGKARVVYFFYSYCPDVCFPTNYILSDVQKELSSKGVLGTDVMMYSISFDPQRDTLERLQQYSKSLEADPSSWYFLRSDPKTIVDLAKQYGIAVIQDEKGNFAHNNYIALVDRKGNIRKYVDASQADADPKDIAKALMQLVKEK